MTISALLLLPSGNALAASEYDKCIKEVNSLKAEETSSCSGFSYIFNPSRCFATRKALKAYTSTDKCKKIGIIEMGDLNTPINKPKADLNSPADEIKSEPHVLNTTCDKLKDENVLLREENNRLKTENEQLRKTGK